MTHSPEPWKHERRKHDGTYDDYETIVDADGHEVVGVGNPNIEDGSYPDMRPNDARRIVACVNACKDWPTERLEQIADSLLPLPLNAPDGDIHAQARAWQAVWSKLWDMGMASFLPTGGTGLDRALEFLDTLSPPPKRV